MFLHVLLEMAFRQWVQRRYLLHVLGVHLLLDFFLEVVLVLVLVDDLYDGASLGEVFLAFLKGVIPVPEWFLLIL